MQINTDSFLQLATILSHKIHAQKIYIEYVYGTLLVNNLFEEYMLPLISQNICYVSERKLAAKYALSK